jgi:glycosyltransferase involved in cell wall biosynthesis
MQSPQTRICGWSKKPKKLTPNIVISVIVPCYNQADYLNEALQSVWEQSYSEWECLIVDDGSQDHSAEIASVWCDRDPRFRYIKKENGGVSQSRNVGIEQSRGFFILPLDGDDKISANYLEGCLKEFERMPATKIVYGKAILFGTEKGDWPLPAFDYQKLLTSNMIYCSAMYRKADWKTIGGYDEAMIHGLEDWDFWLRLLSENDIVTRLQSIVFYYRIKTRSRNADLYNNQLRQKETYDYLYHKHYQKMNTIIGNPIQLFAEKELLSNEVKQLRKEQRHPIYYAVKRGISSIQQLIAPTTK